MQITNILGHLWVIVCKTFVFGCKTSKKMILVQFWSNLMSNFSFFNRAPTPPFQPCEDQIIWFNGQSETNNFNIFIQIRFYFRNRLQCSFWHLRTEMLTPFIQACFFFKKFYLIFLEQGFSPVPFNSFYRPSPFFNLERWRC